MHRKLAFHAEQIQGTRAERLARDSCNQQSILFDSVEAISAGRNSGAFLVKSLSGDFILKIYRQAALDAAARFGRELNFLTWANRRYVDQVPVLRAKSFRSRWIAMEKLPGTTPQYVSDQHVLNAARFVGEIADAKLLPHMRIVRARHQLRIQSPIAHQLRWRLRNLAALFPHDFPLQNLLPSATFLLSKYPESHLEKDIEILRSFMRKIEKPSEAQAIVSPSDFGFHNSVETKVGQSIVLRFFDFEYAGLDHPLKLVMDFALQPDHLLTDNQIGLFLEVLYSRLAISLDEIPNAVWRLFVFKWVLIIAKAMANELAFGGPSTLTGSLKLHQYWERFSGSF